MKKSIMIVAVFAFAFALTASLAFARGGHGHHGHDDGDTTVNNNNSAHVGNFVIAGANSGMNGAHGNRGVGRINTGNAGVTAYADVEANSNYTEIDCGCEGDGDVKVNNTNNAGVLNVVVAGANTGKNGASGNGSSRHGHHRGGQGVGSVNTGDAGVTAGSYTVLNSNVTKIK